MVNKKKWLFAPEWPILQCSHPSLKAFAFLKHTLWFPNSEQWLPSSCPMVQNKQNCINWNLMDWVFFLQHPFLLSVTNPSIGCTETGERSTDINTEVSWAQSHWLLQFNFRWGGVAAHRVLFRSAKIHSKKSNSSGGKNNWARATKTPGACLSVPCWCGLRATDADGREWRAVSVLSHWKLIPVAVSALFNKAGGLLMED